MGSSYTQSGTTQRRNKVMLGSSDFFLLLIITSLFFIDLSFFWTIMTNLIDIFPFVSINKDDICSSFNDEVEYFDSNRNI